MKKKTILTILAVSVFFMTLGSRGRYSAYPITKTTISFTFHHAKITAQGAPTRVTRGVFEGWSLPIWNSDDEELSTCDCMVYQWDGTTDPIIYIGGWLDTANTQRMFQLQVSIETADYVNNEVVPTTSHDYTVETLTGTWPQYSSFKVQVTIDASAIGLAVGKPFAIRIRRIAKTGVEDEIAGEVVIEGASIEITTDKPGGAV